MYKVGMGSGEVGALEWGEGFKGADEGRDHGEEDDSKKVMAA